MYFVDRDVMEKRLAYLENECVFLESVEDFVESKVIVRAVERSIHTIIEAILDVGNAMIDGFIMRDPGSYDDIIDIMVDEKVVESSMEQPLKIVIGLRKQLVTEYWDVDVEELQSVIRHHLGSVKLFATNVRVYLENELGPVSAFTPLETKE